MDQTARAAAARQFAIDIARHAANTRCNSVVVLDVSALSPVTDFYVIATGTSPRQMRTVCEESGELGEGRDYPPLSQAGLEGESWMLVDFVDVILHVFSPDARLYYDLDNLWGDARKVQWQTEAELAAEQARQETQP
ncbi:MAG TPA: ribosome silencing factor [Tepidisphaeraceae bacterium]